MANVDVLSYISGPLKFVTDNWIWIFFIIIFLFVVLVVALYVRGRLMYSYPVRIFRIRENGKVIEHNAKGGYIGRKNSAPFFRIKLGRWWWQYADLSETPKPQFIDEQNRVYYKQIDVNTYVQLRRTFNPNTSVQLTPVESDVKYGAILDIHRVKEVMRQESLLKKLAPYFGLIILFVFGVIGWWMVMNGKCPG